MENIIGTYCNNCRLPYCICEIKHPKQVEEIEADDMQLIIRRENGNDLEMASRIVKELFNQFSITRNIN